MCAVVEDGGGGFEGVLPGGQSDNDRHPIHPAVRHGMKNLRELFAGCGA